MSYSDAGNGVTERQFTNESISNSGVAPSFHQVVDDILTWHVYSQIMLTDIKRDSRGQKNCLWMGIYWENSPTASLELYSVNFHSFGFERIWIWEFEEVLESLG